MTIRAIAANDADAVAMLAREARLAAIPGLPDLHTPQEDLAFYRALISSEHGLVALVGGCGAAGSGPGVVAGFIMWRGDTIEHLYVGLRHQARGIGAALLAGASDMMDGDRISLWTFQSNVKAVGFYVSQGFRIDGASDGRSNEEGLPDFLLTRSQPRAPSVTAAPSLQHAKTSKANVSEALGRAKLSSHATLAAPAILGSLITSRVDGLVVSIRVTEVEAYGGLGEDAGSHAYRRRTARNATMFGPPGHAYAYFTYGMHWMLNVVTQPEGAAGAVLIRAGRVVDGVGVARARRPTCSRDTDLCRGPGRLAGALGIDGGCDGLDLLADGGTLELDLSSAVRAKILVSARTGVAGEAADTPWRFYLPDESTVSPYRAAPSRNGPRSRRP